MIVRMKGVTKRFGDVLAVDDVTLSVDPGEIVGLLGANGAGKTTAIRMLLGLIDPTAGEIDVFGAPPDRETVRRVGYVPQGLGLYADLTAAENMRFQAGVFGFEPSAPPADLTRWWHTPIGLVPLGVRRRVAYEVALGHRPELLILDEPTSGVGPLGRARLWDGIHATADGGAGVLVTTHYLEEAEQCDRLMMLAGGRVVAEGRLDDIVGDATTVVVRAPRLDAAWKALADAGSEVMAAASELRLPGSDRASVVAVLERRRIDAEVEEARATLEETFARLAR